MPNPTANELITDAMLMAGIGDIYNNADSAAVAAGLRWLNDMLDSLSGRPIYVYGETEGTLPLVVGTNTVSIPGGTISTRPVSIDKVSIVDLGNLTYLVRIIGWDEWAGIPYKSASGRPEVVYFDWNAPTIVSYWYPTPSFSGDVAHLYMDTPLTAFTALTQTLQAPQGWSLAIKALLARMYCVAFRLDPSEELKRQARRAELVLQLGHNQPMLLPLAWPLQQRSSTRYNIFTDE